MAEDTIYLIGGTTEANLAARRLLESGFGIVISVATPAGGEIARSAGFATEVGGKDAAAMQVRACEHQAVAIVDCSHPFAEEASIQASQAAAAAGLPYFRYTRAAVDALVSLAAEGSSDMIDAPVITVPAFDSAADLLSRMPGRALLTIGTRHLEPFVRADLDFVARILPLAESLADCDRLGIEPSNIIAAWPPYSIDFNRACLRKYGADIIVTKDSGREGGLPEKLEAAREEHARVIVIQRPVEPGAIHDLDELVAKLELSIGRVPMESSRGRDKT